MGGFFSFFETIVLSDVSNVLGGNFSLVGVPSVGASGAIFGTVAVSGLAHSSRRSHHLN